MILMALVVCDHAQEPLWLSHLRAQATYQPQGGHIVIQTTWIVNGTLEQTEKRLLTSQYLASNSAIPGN